MEEQLKLLEKFASSDNDVIASTAKQLIDLVGQAKDKKITPSELSELTGNLLDAETVDELSETIEHRVIIKEAFAVMAKIISVASTFIPMS